MPTNAVTVATDFSPITLFLQADIVVKVIMLGLLAASIWTWTIIVAQILGNRRAHATSDRFEAEVNEAGLNDEGTKHLVRDPSPAASLFRAAMAEWSKSVRARSSLDKDAARERIADVLQGAIEHEVDRLSEKLNYLATIGSIAPFVGLFGTVWGIMRSLPEQVSRRVARCIARARDGDGAEGKSAGGPMQGTPHPQERAERRAGPSAPFLTGPLNLKWLP